MVFPGQKLRKEKRADSSQNSQNPARACSEGGLQDPVDTGGLGRGGVRAHQQPGTGGLWETQLLGSLAAGLGRERASRSLGHPELPKRRGNPAGRQGLAA